MVNCKKGLLGIGGKIGYRDFCARLNPVLKSRQFQKGVYRARRKWLRRDALMARLVDSEVYEASLRSRDERRYPRFVGDEKCESISSVMWKRVRQPRVREGDQGGRG